MGLLDFVKSAGEKVVGMMGGAPAASLVEHLKAKGLPAEKVQVEYDPASAQVKVSGQTATQAEREKILVALGNIAGVEKVEDNVTAEDGAAEARFYTVQRGDTLGKIAKENYGKASQYPLIFEANRPMLSDPDKIYPGQVLRIPPLEG